MRNLLLLVFVAPAALVAGNVFDVRSNAPAKLFWLGAETSITPHIEEGLDSSKGQYSVSYTTFGGSLAVQYHFPEFYLQGGVGLMRLLSLKVNGVSMEMANRVQWHVPVYAHGYYKIDEFFAVGGGLTHLTETTMYLDGNKVPNSSYHQIFLDAAIQLRPAIAPNLNLLVTLIGGINLLPGRQHTYSIGDLLHARFQANLGAVYQAF